MRRSERRHVNDAAVSLPGGIEARLNHCTSLRESLRPQIPADSVRRKRGVTQMAPARIQPVVWFVRVWVRRGDNIFMQFCVSRLHFRQVFGLYGIFCILRLVVVCSLYVVTPVRRFRMEREKVCGSILVA